MHRVTAVVLASVAGTSLTAAALIAPANAVGPPASCDPVAGSCAVAVTAPPTPSASPTPTPRGRRGTGGCTWMGAKVDCYDPIFGWFNVADGCYYKQFASLPASDPAWAGHYPNGAIYQMTCPGVPGSVGGPVWRAAPPPGLPIVVTAAQLAVQALATVVLPKPTIGRSPGPTNSDNGVPFTWVNVWTWFWTAPPTWVPLAKTARAGGVWATVRLTPSALVFDPGNGDAAVTCAGPGRPWLISDGDAAPTAGGCGYMYRHVSAGGPVTATVSIRWDVTWTGSGGTGGVLPAMTTQGASTFAVEQIQVVNQ